VHEVPATVTKPEVPTTVTKPAVPAVTTRSRRIASKTAILAISVGVVGAVSAVAAPADAQQQTFHLDRLEIPGAPDDGVVLFRPVTEESPTFYAQLALGFALDPLRTSDITKSDAALRASAADVITTQLSTYLSAGFELFDRLTLGATFPSAWLQTGNQPNYPAGIFGGNGAPTSFSTTGPAVGDTRLDARFVVWRDDVAAFGAQISIFVPTGAGSSTNFGGDGPQVEWLPMVSGEWTPPHWPLPLTLVANTGFDFRHDNSLNDPAGHGGLPNGLGVSDEWRWAVGALMPILSHRVRLGLTIFGQTGIKSDSIVGNTAFTAQNTPIEWNAEGRVKLPSFFDVGHWFAGASVGTRIAGGYGAPDLRVLALVGMNIPIRDSNPPSPDARLRENIRGSAKDTDGDGIPDDIDACPTEPEDHKDPDPMDGCPSLPDRDGDGIPDKFDKCPDQPEDKDGVEDADGCPDTDTDHDGIVDANDACPKEPGQPDPDPKKNGCPKFIRLEGSSVRVLQQVHFATGSDIILPESFPMLEEIAQLFKANPDIARVRIEGHTDNRGAAAYNLDLSKRRARSVRQWIVGHGVEASRLESEGYGLTRPVASNDTDDGRAHNRRVEFTIVQQGTDGAHGSPR
jgi:OOP family OmpA-OmpF porin